jgi:hypothetical protein
MQRYHVRRPRDRSLLALFRSLEVAYGAITTGKVDARNGSERMSPRSSRACELRRLRAMRLRAPASIALGSIDADERDTRLRKRNRDASGPASELEDGTLLLQASVLQKGTSPRPSVRAFSQS